MRVESGQSVRSGGSAIAGGLEPSNAQRAAATQALRGGRPVERRDSDTVAGGSPIFEVDTTTVISPERLSEQIEAATRPPLTTKTDAGRPRPQPPGGWRIGRPLGTVVLVSRALHVRHAALSPPSGAAATAHRTSAPNDDRLSARHRSDRALGRVKPRGPTEFVTRDHRRSVRTLNVVSSTGLERTRFGEALDRLDPCVVLGDALGCQIWIVEPRSHDDSDTLDCPGSDVIDLVRLRTTIARQPDNRWRHSLHRHRRSSICFRGRDPAAGCILVYPTGEIVFTRIPCSAPSIARMRINPTTAHLAAA